MYVLYLVMSCIAISYIFGRDTSICILIAHYPFHNFFLTSQNKIRLTRILSTQGVPKGLQRDAFSDLKEEQTKTAMKN